MDLSIRNCQMAKKSPLLTDVSILLVEDEPITRDILIDILEAEGAVALFEESIENALNTFRTFIPDCLMSNVSLPDGSGYSLVERLRQIEFEIGVMPIPAIAIFDSTRSVKEQKASVAGFQAVISKPWQPNDIINTIMTVTGRASRRDLTQS